MFKVKHTLISANKQTEQVNKLLFLLLERLLALFSEKEEKSATLDFMQRLKVNDLMKFSFTYILQQCITLIDLILTKQVNIIIHTNQFQQLEAGWRGVYYLVHSHPCINSKIKLLDFSLKELIQDLNSAIEVEQTHLFWKVHINEFDSPGGEPFGLIIGNYEFDYDMQNLLALQVLARIAAISFCPFILGISAAFFDLEHYGQLTSINIKDTVKAQQYEMWHRIRQDPAMGFIGMTSPRVLMRVPYYNIRKKASFIFSEKIINQSDLLWGNASFCFAALVLYSFEQFGWFSNILGLMQTINDSKTIISVTKHCYTTEYFIANGIEVIVTNKVHMDLNALGIMTFCNVKYEGNLAIYDCPSLQKATHNVELNSSNMPSKLHYILCISRFAHYLKVIARDKLGSYLTATELERFLQNWLSQYTASIENISSEMIAKYPLNNARVEISELRREPGHFIGNIWLTPYFQGEEVKISLNLKSSRRI